MTTIETCQFGRRQARLLRRLGVQPSGGLAQLRDQRSGLCAVDPGLLRGPGRRRAPRLRPARAGRSELTSTTLKSDVGGAI